MKRGFDINKILLVIGLILVSTVSLNGQANAQACGTYPVTDELICLDYKGRQLPDNTACQTYTSRIDAPPTLNTANCPYTCCTQTHYIDGVAQTPTTTKRAGTCTDTYETTPPPTVTAQRECRHVQTYANEVSRWSQTSSSCSEAINALEARCNSERGEATSAGSVSNQLTLSGGSCVVQYNCPRRWRIEYQECRSVYSDGTTGNWGRGDAGGQTRVGWSRGSTQGYYY